MSLSGSVDVQPPQPRELYYAAPVTHVYNVVILFVCSFYVGHLYCPSYPPVCFVSYHWQIPLYDLPILYVLLYMYTFVSDNYTIQLGGDNRTTLNFVEISKSCKKAR